MPKSLARAITSFTAQERRKLLYQARPIFKHPGLDIRSLHTTLPHGRILIVTPKKVGSAPQRNLVKRRLKALYYEEQLYKQPADLLVFCKKGSAELSFEELKQIVMSALANSVARATGQKAAQKASPIASENELLLVSGIAKDPEC